MKVHDFMNKFLPGIAYPCLVVKMAGHTNQFSPEIQTVDDFLTIVKGHNLARYDTLARGCLAK